MWCLIFYHTKSRMRLRSTRLLSIDNFTHESNLVLVEYTMLHDLWLLSGETFQINGRALSGGLILIYFLFCVCGATVMVQVWRWKASEWVHKWGLEWSSWAPRVRGPPGSSRDSVTKWRQGACKGLQRLDMDTPKPARVN